MGEIIMEQWTYAVSFLIVLWGVLFIYALVQAYLFYKSEDKAYLDWVEYSFINNPFGAMWGLVTAVITFVILLVIIVHLVASYLVLIT